MLNFNKSLKAFLAIVLVGIASLLMHGSAYAAAPVPQNTIPNSGDFDQTTRVNLITAIYGNGYVLDSPVNTVRWYSPNQAGNDFNIINGGNCPGTNGDVGPDNSQATTVFRVYSLNPVPSVNYINTPFGARKQLLKTITNTQIGCAASYSVTGINSGESAVGVGPAGGQYAFEIEATMTGPAGWNMFKYQVAPGDGRLSYYAGSTDHFAVKAVDTSAGLPGDPGDFKFGFAPGCGLQKNVYLDPNGPHALLKFFDPDAGVANQNFENPVRTTLIEYDGVTGTQTGSWDYNTSLGNNVGGSFDITSHIRGYHKYEWVWHNIYSDNGVQFQMPYDSYNTLIDFNAGGDCTQPQTDNATCSITTNPATLNTTVAPNTPIVVTIKATNTGSTTWSSTYYMKRVGPQVVNLQNVSGTVPPGAPPYTFTDNVTAPPSGTKTITYRMYNANGPFGTVCSRVITVACSGAGCSQPGGDISVSCKQTAVTGLSSTATYTHTTTTTTQPPKYLTGIPPAQWPLWPYPPGPPPATPQQILSGTVWTYTPPPQTVTTTQTLPANIIPIQIHFSGDDGSNNDFYDKLGNPGNKTYNTFVDFGFLKPHVIYTVTLSAQTSGSLGEDQNGPYSYSQVGQQETLTQCLQANLNQVCAGGSGSTVEVGQPGSISYTIVLDNLTNKQFDTSFGYNILAQLGPGLAFNGPQSQDVTIPIGLSQSISASFSVIVNHSDTFSVVFRYGGTPVTGLPPDAWDATCQGVSATAQAWPYFQAWSGDISAGGGFRSPGIGDTGSCGGSGDSPYVSPVSSGGDQYSGGIRAFGRQDSNRGARVDFGALALGLIPGTSGGRIGFYSGNQSNGQRSVFANNLAGIFSSNMGGYLNSNSQSHCASDYFTNTKLNPSVSSGDLQTDINNCTDRCQYNFDGYTLNAAAIPAGKQVTVFVDHDITIVGNINLGSSFNPNQPANIPYFALIVRGNITLTGGVNKIEGLYVAQPNGSRGGIFATCDNNPCTNQLVVNGAVIAQHVQLLRNHGTLDAAPNDVNGIGGNPAEIFNYVPSMVLGAPAFVSQFGGVQSLFSLPPVF